MNLDKLKPISSADVKGKRVIVRADLNVPVQDGKVSDATRLTRLIPGLKELAGRGAKVIVLSHFGRPKERNTKDSLKPVAETLASLAGMPIAFADDCVGDVAVKAIEKLPFGGIIVLENTRFHTGEEVNRPRLVEAMAALGDIYVNDAFSAAHRAHASTEGIAHLLPAYAGPLMMEEINALKKSRDAYGKTIDRHEKELVNMSNALLAIIAEERPTSNATVKRMARIARTALGK